uniref:Uncharacterized protein n=1 Tax=Neisseria meningitidis alpha522 TaxID=996307 RepID=I4E5W4_NEIME|nr:hypothetical protein NMALPHA522_1189 [Neisseria meningitidis alpha522]
MSKINQPTAEIWTGLYAFWTKRQYKFEKSQ